MADNRASAGPDLYGTAKSSEYNLLKIASGAPLSGSHNITEKDPQLGPLQNKGGPAFTYALLAGSPAFDAGNTSLATDQRGTSRPQGVMDDIGAYEMIVSKGAPSPMWVQGPDGSVARVVGTPPTISPMLAGESLASTFVAFTTKVRDLDGYADLSKISLTLECLNKRGL